MSSLLSRCTRVRAPSHCCGFAEYIVTHCGCRLLPASAAIASCVLHASKTCGTPCWKHPSSLIARLLRARSGMSTAAATAGGVAAAKPSPPMLPPPARAHAAPHASPVRLAVAAAARRRRHRRGKALAAQALSVRLLQPRVRF